MYNLLLDGRLEEHSLVDVDIVEGEYFNALLFYSFKRDEMHIWLTQTGHRPFNISHDRSHI